MADIKQLEEIWCPEAIAFLNKYSIDKTKLKLVVHKICDPIEVALFQNFASTNICLNGSLCSQNLAISTGEVYVNIKPKYRPILNFFF